MEKYLSGPLPHGRRTKLVRLIDRVAQGHSVALLGECAEQLRGEALDDGNTSTQQEMTTLVNGTRGAVISAIAHHAAPHHFQQLIQALINIDKCNFDQSMRSVLLDTAEKIIYYTSHLDSDEETNSEDGDSSVDKKHKLAVQERREGNKKLRKMIHPKVIKHLLEAVKDMKELTDPRAPPFPSKEDITRLLSAASTAVDNAILFEVDGAHIVKMAIEMRDFWDVVARQYNFGGTGYVEVKDDMVDFIRTMKDYLFGEHDNNYEDDEEEEYYDGRYMTTEEMLTRIIAKAEGGDYYEEEEEDYSGNISDQDRFDPQAQEEINNQHINVRLSMLHQKKAFEWMREKGLYDEYVNWIAEEARAHRVPSQSFPRGDLPSLYSDVIS